MEIHELVVGPLKTNCYIVTSDMNHAVIIDPGFDAEKIAAKIRELGAKPKFMLLTHGHFDHIWGSKELRELSGAKIFALDKERTLCESVDNNLSAMVGRAYTVVPDEYLSDGTELTFDNISLKVIATPGHTIGSCCYYAEKANILISGDTLFQESTGRTDFPTGSMSSIVRSIREKLFVLPDETKVYPGHGDSTTIAYEKKYNPFVAE